MPIPSTDDIARWTDDQRATVARRLDELVERPAFACQLQRRRVTTIGVVIPGAIVLWPWIVHLASSLPQHESVRAWRSA